MTFSVASISEEPFATPQSLHLEAMTQLEKSVEHHRQAAAFHEAGDTRQAATHGTIAFDRAAHAVEISGRALCIQPLVARPHKKTKFLSWHGLAFAFEKLRIGGNST
jgi:hypothetical protein